MLSNETEKQELNHLLIQSFKTFLKIIPLALVLSLLYTAVMAHRFATYPVHLCLSATGKMDKNSRAPIVWLKNPKLEEIESTTQIFKTAGWKYQDPILISESFQPAELVLRGYLRQRTDLIFDKTPFSGIVEVEFNQKAEEIDLFQSSSAPFILPLSEWLENSGPSWKHGFYVFTFEFFCHFLPLTFFLRLIYPFYAALPELSLHPVVSETSDRTIARRILIVLSASTLLFFYIAFFPGLMYADSYGQYQQAIFSEFQDWYPPSMAALWTITDEIIPGPGGMFLLHISMTIFALYLLSRAAVLKDKKLYFLPLILIFLPFISNLLYALLKDIAMAVSFLLAFSAWYYWRINGKLSKLRLALIFVLLFYGITVRHNALPAAIPLIFLIVSDLMPRRKALMISGLLVLTFFLANIFLSYSILKAEKKYIFQALLAHDLMGIYKITGKNYVPENYVDQTHLDQVMVRFDHTHADSTINQPETRLVFDPIIIASLRQHWVRALREQPFAYLKHRWLMFSKLLSSSNGSVRTFTLPPFSFMNGKRTPLLHDTSLGAIHTSYVIWSERQLHFLFIPLTYVGIATATFILSVHRKMRIAAALSSSAILYICTYFLSAPEANFRYSYWSILATLLAIYSFWMGEKDMKKT